MISSTLLGRVTSPRFHRTLLAAAGVALLPVASASAAVYVSTLEQPSASTGYGITSSQYLGVGFTTGGSLGGYQLNEVTLSLYWINDEVSLLAPKIYASEAGTGLPVGGPLFADFALITPGTEATDYTFTVTAPFLLTANTAYVLTFGSSAIMGGYGALATSDPSTNVGGWSMGDFMAVTSDSGATWGRGDSLNLKVSVDASAVPEPSAFIFLGVAGMAVMALRRRRPA